MSKIYFVEGLPGAGKSTKAKEIYEQIKAKNKNVILMCEHDIENLIDISRKAFLSNEEYKEFLNKCNNIASLKNCKYEYNEIKDKINRYTKKINNIYIISYFQIFFDNRELNEFISQLYKKEICNGNCSFNEYKSVIFKMWEEFDSSIQEDSIYVIDGGLLHNPLFDIIGYYNLTNEDVFDFYKNIFKIIKNSEIEIIYVKMNNIEETIKERRSKRWIGQFSKWIEESQYGKENNLIGFNGIIEFYKKKMEMEEIIIQYLNKLIIELRRK